MAADGSAPFIPLSVPEIGGNEWAYIKECLDTNWVSTAGPFVERFELEFARKLGASHAVACQSGTAALHVALLVAGIGPGDEVLVPALTFVAPANAIRYADATPVLVDVEPKHAGIDLNLVEAFLREDCARAGARLVNRTSGRRVAGVMPVHLLGHPVDMDRLMALAEEFGLIVIEDATESLGATYKERHAGTIGHLGCFSFNGNKIMTTGGGGMIVTARADWAKRAKHLTNQAKVDPIEYDHDEIGYNYRLTNIQAAMGVAQLERLDAYVEAKRAIAARYADAFADVPGLCSVPQANWARTNWWLYTVLIESAEFGIDSRALLRRLDAQRIQARPLWRPLHMGPPHRGERVLGGDVAKRFNAEGLSLPSSVGLAPEQQARVIEAVRSAARRD